MGLQGCREIVGVEFGDYIGVYGGSTYVAHSRRKR